MPTGSSTYGTIVVASEPRGVFSEGYCNAAMYPGIALSIANVAPSLGRFTYSPWATAGTPLMILIEDRLQGRTVDKEYASGERIFFYHPLPGEFLLVRAAAATYTIGQALIPANGTGVWANGAGAVRSMEAVVLAEPALLLAVCATM